MYPESRHDVIQHDIHVIIGFRLIVITLTIMNITQQ